MRGGAREGAGRKPTNTKDVRIRLTPEEHQLLGQLGGSAWIREQLEKGKEKMLKVKEQAQSLIDEIREQISSDCEDEQEFLERALDALEDGEFLNVYFNGEENDMNTAIAEEAHKMIEEQMK